MPITYIQTGKLKRVRTTDNGGEFAEIVNRDLCGAEDVSASLRWLESGESLEAESMSGHHQMIYLIEGAGQIELEHKKYPVERGAGVYLAPNEVARVSSTGDSTLKLLHLVSAS